MAKSLNLTSFGLIRDAAEDFSDDGNRFTCYRDPISNARVSKCNSKNKDGTNEYYISIQYKLPNGEHLYFDAANGIHVNLTDLSSFMNASQVIANEILSCRQAHEEVKALEVRPFTEVEFKKYHDLALESKDSSSYMYNLGKDYKTLGFMPTEKSYKELEKEVNHSVREARPITRDTKRHQLNNLKDYIESVATSSMELTGCKWCDSESEKISIKNNSRFNKKVMFEYRLHDKETAELKALAEDFKAKYDALVKETFEKAFTTLNISD